MINNHTLELFIIKCAVIESDLRSVISKYNVTNDEYIDKVEHEKLDRYIKQFDIENRQNALRMSKYYEIFYMLENDIRKLISETMETAHGPKWWDSHVPIGAKEEVKKNKTREMQAGISTRSDHEIDYTTFGQLSDIIKDNWTDFAGMLSNQNAVSRVMSALNMLRGTIAHCGILAEDEVDRLKLAIRDWFRVLEGPKP